MTKKQFSSLSKVESFFTKKLNRMVNNAPDREKLYCPYSRFSELLILSKVLNNSDSFALNDMLNRHENLQRRIRQENMDLKGIVNRQGRELVSGKGINIKVAYESEIYLLKLSISEANIIIQKIQSDIDKILETNSHEDDEGTLKKKIKQLTAQISALESQVKNIQSEIDKKKGIKKSKGGNNEDDTNIDDEINQDDEIYHEEEEVNSEFKEEEEEEIQNDVNEETNVGNGVEEKGTAAKEEEEEEDVGQKIENSSSSDEREMAIESVASLKALPGLIHEIFEKLFQK